MCMSSVFVFSVFNSYILFVYERIGMIDLRE